VFPSEKYAQVVETLVASRGRREPQVYCGVNWRTLGNRHYNIAPYDGVNISFD
jgi:hypothetical protein